MGITKLSKNETELLGKGALKMVFSVLLKRHDIFLNKTVFLDKELFRLPNLSNHNGYQSKMSWIYFEITYINQQIPYKGFNLFEAIFTLEQLEKHFDFYEPFTVHGNPHYRHVLHRFRLRN